MNIAVIGCGNMASKVIRQMYNANKKINFYTYTPSKTRAQELAKIVNGVVVNSIDDFNFEEIDYWVIGCKPQQVKDLAKEFNSKLKDKNIVSMLAATSISKLSELFNSNQIMRIMPNTPIGLGHGITLVTKHSDFKNSNEFLTHLKSGSYILETKTEKELDEITVFSGSGPAYVFYFALTLEQKLVSLGYDESESRKIINNLFVGSSVLMNSSKSSLSELLDQVTSKGGVTIEAIKEYQISDLSGITSKAIDKALRRTEQIAQELK